jgi:DNA-binding transcriptional regulator YiaG
MFQSSEEEKHQRSNEHEKQVNKPTSSHKCDYNRVMTYIFVEKIRYRYNISSQQHSSNDYKHSSTVDSLYSY